MVYITRIFFSAVKTKRPNKFRKSNFVDRLRIYVRGGSGGNGFPKYGGIGGKGGDVYVVSTNDIKLSDIQKKNEAKRFIASHGEPSQRNKLLGKCGEDKVIKVPVGITVVNEFGQLLGDLHAENHKILVARGGAGGCPATNFTGLRGESYSVTLDLKLIADISLVGFPNAGKSSLLRGLSNAKPAVASYPFTTLQPHLGVLQYPDYRKITVADLPGLIEGAHQNIGMGHKFLKHVERTKMLLLVIDIQGFQLSPSHPHRSALETVILLNKEIELYQQDLLKKPVVLAINKMDTEGAQNKFLEIQDKLKHLKDIIQDFPEEFRPNEIFEFWDILNISATADKSSVLNLKEKLRYFLDIYAEQLKADTELSLSEKLQKRITEQGPSVV